MSGSREEPVKKINPYMLEDPMYQYVLQKKEREKADRIKMLRTLLDESSSETEGVGKKHKKKKKKKKVKKSKSSDKKSKSDKKKKKKKVKKKQSSSESSDSSSSSSDSSDERHKHSKDEAAKHKDKTPKTAEVHSNNKKHTAKRKEKRKRRHSSSSSSSSSDEEKHSSHSKTKVRKIDSSANGSRSAGDKDKKHKHTSPDRHGADRYHRKTSPDRRRRSASREHSSRNRSRDRGHHVDSRHGEKRPRSSSQNRDKMKPMSEVERLIARERARLKEQKDKEMGEIEQILSTDGKNSPEKETKRKKDRENSEVNSQSGKTTWDAYIDNMMHQSEDESGRCHISRACIIALDGGVRWTSDTHPNAIVPSAEEAAFLAEHFEAKNLKPFSEQGITVEGIRYDYLGSDSKQNRTLLGSKEGVGSITLHSSKTALVIAHSASHQKQLKAYKGARIIAEYLEAMDL